MMWLVLPVLLGLIGLILFEKNISVAYDFFIVGTIWLLLYPFYSRWFYKRHYKKYVNQYFDPTDADVTLQFDDEILNTSSKKGNSSIKIRELLSFVEIKDYFLLQLNKQAYFIVPKDRVEADMIREHLLKCSESLGVPYLEELDWKWK